MVSPREAVVLLWPNAGEFESREVWRHGTADQPAHEGVWSAIGVRKSGNKCEFSYIILHLITIFEIQN